MERIIVITEAELTILIEKAVQNAMKSLPPAEIPKEIGGLELAMEITGLSKSALYSYCSKKKIPHIKIGNKLRFNRKDLMKWCEEKRQ